MDIMKQKDTVDEIVKTGKAIMSSKNPEEKEALKVKYCVLFSTQLLKWYYLCTKAKYAVVVVFLFFLSGQDPGSLGKVQCCQSAEFRALTPAGASAVTGWPVLGDI